LPPPKKKGTLKQKIAGKEAERKRRLENGEFDGEYMDMREKFMDEKEMRRIMREKELEADMNNASDLFGAATLQPASSGATGGGSKTAAVVTPKLPAHLAPFLKFPAKLTTKADFDALSRLIYTNLIQPHATSGQYAAFVETHTKALCSTLKEGETRKVANVVAGLVTEKVAAARAAAKKKTGGAAVVSGKGMLAGEGGGKGK
jgi:translation initiation factor 3 subunit J